MRISKRFLGHSRINNPKIRKRECEKYISMRNVMTTMRLYTDGDFYSQFTPIFVGVLQVAHFYSHSNLRNPYIVESLVPPERLELPTH